MSPWKIGLRRGASSQSHSMSRSKKMRIMRSRWRWVFLARFGPVLPGWLAKPHLVVLDVRPGDAGHDGDVGLGDQPAGELAQRVVGRLPRSAAPRMC